MLACEDRRLGAGLYLVAVQCSQSYVVCQSGSVAYVHVCPPGTVFHVDWRTCLDEQACRSDKRSVDRNKRQIKFILVDDNSDSDSNDDDNDDASNSHRVARRQIKFRSISPTGYDSDPRSLVPRQIKFRSLPVNFDEESAILDDPPTQYDADRRRPRQIKFRSLAERAVEPKKHEKRQLNIDALSNSDDQPVMTYSTDVNRQFQLPTFLYRRR